MWASDNDVSRETAVSDRGVGRRNVVRGLHVAVFRDTAHGFEHKNRRASRILAAGGTAQRMASTDQTHEDGDCRLHFLKNLVKHDCSGLMEPAPYGSGSHRG